MLIQCLFSLCNEDSCSDILCWWLLLRWLLLRWHLWQVIQGETISCYFWVSLVVMLIHCLFFCNQGSWWLLLRWHYKIIPGETILFCFCASLVVVLIHCLFSRWNQGNFFSDMVRLSMSIMMSVVKWGLVWVIDWQCFVFDAMVLLFGGGVGIRVYEIIVQ